MKGHLLSKPLAAPEPGVKCAVFAVPKRVDAHPTLHSSGKTERAEGAAAGDREGFIAGQRQRGGLLVARVALPLRMDVSLLCRCVEVYLRDCTLPHLRALTGR